MERRGAPWTFDAPKFFEAVKLLAAGESDVSLPAFDHAKGDPEPDAVLVQQNTKIVIVEGNYLLLDEPVWRDLATLVSFLFCGISMYLFFFFLVVCLLLIISFSQFFVYL